jgi:hypothetical protein
MAITTYATLKSSIISWAKRGDIATLVDDFIDLAEADIWERLRVREMDSRATATASTSERYLALPDSYLEMRKLRLYSGDNLYELDFVVPETLSPQSSSGIPTSYTITSQLEFNKVPSSAYTVEMQYYKSLTALSSSNTSNAVLTRYPMLYMYGALFHFANWSLNDVMASKYATLFAGAIDAANKAEKKGRYGAAKAMKSERPTP